MYILYHGGSQGSGLFSCHEKSLPPCMMQQILEGEDHSTGFVNSQEKHSYVVVKMGKKFHLEALR